MINKSLKIININYNNKSNSNNYGNYRGVLN